MDQRARCVCVLADYLLAEGLARTSLRQLAEAAEVSNRMLLYYFKDKTEILSAVAVKIAADLMVHLGEGIPEGLRLSPADLLKTSAAMMLTGELRPYMRLSIEMVAAAGRDTEPYASLASGLFGGFLSWVEVRLETKDAAQRKEEATMILAMIDGLTLLALAGKGAEAEAALERMVRILKV